MSRNLEKETESLVEFVIEVLVRKPRKESAIYSDSFVSMVDFVSNILDQD